MSARIEMQEEGLCKNLEIENEVQREKEIQRKNEKNRGNICKRSVS